MSVDKDQLFPLEDAVREIAVIVRMARAAGEAANEFPDPYDVRYAVKVLISHLSEIQDICGEMTDVLADAKAAIAAEEEAENAPKPASGGKRK